MGLDGKMRLIGTNAEKGTVVVELRSAEWEALCALQDGIDNSDFCSPELLRLMGTTSITPQLIVARKFIFSLRQLKKIRSLMNEAIWAMEVNIRQCEKDGS